MTETDSRGTSRCAELELQARAGRAVLIGHGSLLLDPGDLQLPSGLEPALHEWARVAETVGRAGDCEREPGVLVSQRGRLLAARLADATGVPVAYGDPMAGGMEILAPGQDQEPTPWATGGALSAATAALVGIALFALSEGLAARGAWSVVVANIVVAAGLAPSIWLTRTIPIWRWVAYGAAGGILLTWITLLLSLLG
ncbi:MAG: DUF2537 domain-containing protein [Pseudonocardiaceae bacterium]